MPVSRTTTLANDQTLLQGIATSMPAPSLPLGKKVYTQSSLTTLIKTRIDLANEIDQAKASWVDAVQRYENLDLDARQVVRDLRNAVIAAYGGDSPKLAEFGFKPPKLAVRTPEEKALAAQRRKATRAAHDDGLGRTTVLRGVAGEGTGVFPAMRGAATGVFSASG
jgi:hypothetical protein